MQTTQKRSVWRSGPGGFLPGVSLSWTMPAILACVCCWGCTPAGQVEEAGADRCYAITLDQGDNGAVAASNRAGGAEHAVMARTLSFEMAGFSRRPATGDQREQRAAATQAAIIDALCKALIEARRDRGQTDADFTARLGPRLTVTHCTTNDGDEVHIELISRGVETTFAIRDGRLQHPPHDLKLIHRIFEETNGEFSLFGTDWSADTGTCVATVGCYLPAGLGAALAGGVAARPDEDAETP